MVPNIPLLAAFTKASDMEFLKKMAFKSILWGSKPKEFHMKTVNEFLFGYSDNFVEMTPGIDSKRVGLMAGRRG